MVEDVVIRFSHEYQKDSKEVVGPQVLVSSNASKVEHLEYLFHSLRSRDFKERICVLQCDQGLKQFDPNVWCHSLLNMLATMSQKVNE